MHAKNKGRKLGHGLQLAQEEKHHCICINNYMNTQNYLKVSEETIEEMKELKNISRDVLFLQLTIQDFIGQLKHLNFILKII